MKCKASRCAKCGVKDELTRHHILPQRHFSDSPILTLCRKCHDKIELRIPFNIQPTEFYFQVVGFFLGEDNE